MKDSFFNLLEDFEKLVYKVLMWVILVPKTIFKITVDVGFVPDYVRGELKSEKGKQFDEYVSPILLYLGVTLLPAIAISLLKPTGLILKSYQDDPKIYFDGIVKMEDGSYYGTSDPYIVSLVQNSTADGDEAKIIDSFVGYELGLQVILTSIADAQNQFHVFDWYIYECGNRSGNGNCMFDVLWDGVRHDQNNGSACYQGTVELNEYYGGFQDDSLCIDILSEEFNHPENWNWLPNLYLEVIEDPLGSKVVDTYYMFFDTDVNEYKVEVYAKSFDADGKPVEAYKTTSIIRQIGSELSITSNGDSSYLRETSVDPIISLFEADGEVGNEKETASSLTDRLEQSETIFFGLGLLLPPLFFAGAIGLFMGAKPSLSEEALKEHFYSQCYYFTPVGLAFWAWYYTSYFHTQDILLPRNLLWIPFALALMWFFVVELLSIAETLPSRSKLKAFFIFWGCIFFMGLLVWLGAQLRANSDWLRESAIWSYFVVGVLLAVGLAYNQAKNLRKKKRKVDS